MVLRNPAGSGQLVVHHRHFVAVGVAMEYTENTDTNCGDGHGKGFLQSDCQPQQDNRQNNTNFDARRVDLLQPSRPPSIMKLTKALGTIERRDHPFGSSRHQWRSLQAGDQHRITGAASLPLHLPVCACAPVLAST